MTIQQELKERFKVESEINVQFMIINGVVEKTFVKGLSPFEKEYLKENNLNTEFSNYLKSTVPQDMLNEMKEKYQSIQSQFEELRAKMKIFNKELEKIWNTGYVPNSPNLNDIEYLNKCFNSSGGNDGI